MVAYDTNARENQFLQGWLMQDRFLLRGAFGVPYEFLWANPYQPGLSPFYMPLYAYDELSGRVFVRSSWEDDASWFGCFDGESQKFEQGRIQVLAPDAATRLRSRPRADASGGQAAQVPHWKAAKSNWFSCSASNPARATTSKWTTKRCAKSAPVPAVS